MSNTQSNNIASINTLRSNDVIDNIDLTVLNKKQFTVNGDSTKLLALNTSDMNIVRRLDEVYPKLLQLAQTVGDKLPEEEVSDEDKLEALSNTISEIDTEMRALIDYLFDSNVSEMCAPFGSMYDPINGQLRFEHIIDTLTKLYESNLNIEYKKMKIRMDKHTKKYVTK